MNSLSQPEKQLHRFEVGWAHRYGPLALTRDEIRAYAELVDPQPLHLDQAYARQTRFGDIIASGMHPYTAFHKRYWIPLVAETFICGMSIEGVNFSGPVFPDQPLWGELTTTDVVPKPEKRTAVVGWRWVFFDADGNELQRVGYHSYHHLIR